MTTTSISKEQLESHIIKREVKDGNVILYAACGGQAMGKVIDGNEALAEDVALFSLIRHDKCDHIRSITGEAEPKQEATMRTRTVIKGKVVPDWIIRFGTEVIEGTKLPRLELVKPTKKDWGNRFFQRLCISEANLRSAAAQEFYGRVVIIQKIWKDQSTGHWMGERFRPEEYMDMVNRASTSGLVPQYRKAKDPTGGGKGGSAGKFFISRKEDNVMVCDSMFRTILKVDPDRMEPRERVSRTSILFSDVAKFKVPPVVKVANMDGYGVVWVSQRYAMEHGIERGDKLHPIKASAQPMTGMMEAQGLDMLIPQDAIKFKEHLENPELLASMMGSIPSLTAKERSSVEKDRVPRFALDTMQWLFPEITQLFGDQSFMTRLEHGRKIIEGRGTIEEVMKLGEYTRPDGTPGWASEFLFLQKGQPLADKTVRKAVFKTAGTFIRNVLCFKVAGRYGVAMPVANQDAARRRLVFLPPWMMPFWVNTDISHMNVIGVDSDWVVECLGKDYDGDLAIVLILDKLMHRLGLGKDIFPDWTTKEGQDWAKQALVLPTKDKKADPRPVHEVMKDGLKGYGLIGIATNLSMVVVDTLRLQGMSKRELQAVYLRLMSGEVQQFVDALKYVPGGLYAPKLEDFETRKGRVYKGLCSKYGADEKLATKVRAYFNAVRRMDIDTLCTLPEDETLKGSFYYSLASLFRGWKPVPALSMVHVAEKYLAGKVVPPTLDKVRRRTFATLGGDTEARVKVLLPMASTRELQEILVALCWRGNGMNSDSGLALSLEAQYGFRLLELARGAGIKVEEGIGNVASPALEEEEAPTPEECC